MKRKRAGIRFQERAAKRRRAELAYELAVLDRLIEDSKAELDELLARPLPKEFSHITFGEAADHPGSLERPKPRITKIERVRLNYRLVSERTGRQRIRELFGSDSDSDTETES